MPIPTPLFARRHVPRSLRECTPRRWARSTLDPIRSDIPVPENMKILPEVLREAGYYTTNNVKLDYNFSHEGRWDESSSEAHWRNRPEGKPFFSVFNLRLPMKAHQPA